MTDARVCTRSYPRSCERDRVCRSAGTPVNRIVMRQRFHGVLSSHSAPREDHSVIHAFRSVRSVARTRCFVRITRINLSVSQPCKRILCYTCNRPCFLFSFLSPSLLSCFACSFEFRIAARRNALRSTERNVNYNRREKRSPLNVLDGTFVSDACLGCLAFRASYT